MTEPGDAVKDGPAAGGSDRQSSPGFGRFDRRSSDQMRLETEEREAVHPPPDPKDLVPPWGTRLLTAMFAIVVIVVMDVLLSVWPSAAPAGASAETAGRVTILWGLLPVTVTANDRFMLIAVLMGAIGALVHVMTSFADFVGNKRLAKDWLPWYFLRPIIGSGLALFFYVGFRAGLLTASTADGSVVNPFGIAAIGGLAGMFSKQATDKLNEVFSTMFKTSADDRRGGKLGANASTRPVAAPAPTAVGNTSSTNTTGSAGTTTS